MVGTTAQDFEGNNSALSVINEWSILIHRKAQKELEYKVQRLTSLDDRLYLWHAIPFQKHLEYILGVGRRQSRWCKVGERAERKAPHSGERSSSWR